MLSNLLAAAAAAAALCLLANAQQQQQQQRLHRRLLSDYDTNSRPVLRADTPVTVTFSLKVNRLMDLDEKNQILHLNVVVMESWTDERLRWRPEEFGGHRRVVLPASAVWLPDLYIYNNAADGSDGFVNDNSSRLTVDYRGTVLWNIPVLTHSSCSIDVLYFPFDHQRCSVLFASWTHDAQQLRLRTPLLPIDGEEMEENSELKVTTMRLRRRVQTVNRFVHHMLVLQLHIQRKPLYYYYTVIAPSIMLCFLTLSSFCLPCHIAEKIEIGLNVFLFLYFLELLIAENTPESNATPLIGIFLTIVMSLNSLSLIVATVVMHVYSRSDQDPCPMVPKCLWALTHRFLGPLTFSRLQFDFDGKGGCLLAAGVTSRSRRKSSRVDQGVESAKWRYVAEVMDKFLLELFLLCTVVSTVVVLHIVPTVNAHQDPALSD